MLKNISIRTVIIVFLICNFTTINIIFLLSLPALIKLVMLNIVCVFTFICSWFYITTYLVKPINAVKNSIDEVNAGNLSVRIPVFGNNCAGRLIPGVNQLAESLSLLVSEIRSSSDSASVLSEQLAMRSFELSAKTEQQSAMLVETASNMEEIAVGTKNNAENTVLVSEHAQEATEFAVYGGKLMAEVAANMHSINECTNKMTEIITLIDSIAFQTNILALNAAVEAARAGEHGRGFTVVAGEVRNLAHRSSESAKNIKSLISVTTDNVKQGEDIVHRAEVNMNKIVEGAERVNGLMAQISVSTQQQQQGIEQIATALSELEQATQGSVMIADELAGSSDALKAQVADLQSRTRDFRLTDHAAVQPHSKPALNTGKRAARFAASAQA
ncbi:methyl-accepting chemotaxis protein [Morganella sp. GD04133]|uniref:methyl-accepting chemotaxis protein n=1 Tax=Morganella sp. GD04133 TaxID=2975435 RepID=UPI0024493BD6|nr:methyl-accepting chemotaxis protein [Morganella sp. GD04133]MDH0355447.1 methyl-accepting chemotaxis protein [Morganella sp. GD04133]